MSDNEKQGMGCFAKGCLTLVVVVIVCCGIAVAGGYYYLNLFVKELTSDKPREIKVEQPTEVQMQAAAAKSQALSDAYRSGKEVTVELTGQDLNALIARNADLAPLRGRFYTSIANSEISADFSVPLEFLGWSMFKGRYFNGRGVAFFEWNNGEITIKPKLLEANNKQVPSVGLSQINSSEGQRGINDALKKPNMKSEREQLNRFKSIRVAGDRLIIVTRAGPPATK